MSVRYTISIFAGLVIMAGAARAVEVSFQLNAAPVKCPRHADVWIPQLANRTYLEMEQE